MADSGANSQAAAAATETPKVEFKFEEQVMAYSALYTMALICIVWGSVRSLRFIRSQIMKKELLQTSITTREAKKFPITASLVLFTLYLVFKTNSHGSSFIVEKARPYLPLPVMEKVDWVADKYLKSAPVDNSTAAANSTGHPGYIAKLGDYHPVLKTAVTHPWVEKPVSYLPELSKTNLIFALLLLLCWEGCAALAIITKPVFSAVLRRVPVGNRWPRRNVPYLLTLREGKHEMADGELEEAEKKHFDYVLHAEWDTHLAIAFFFCSFVGISHLYRRHWITNDLLGVAFSIYGIENLHLASFKAGAILLSGLFIYDVFWVFATEVMTTVAKGIDAPILLMFPQDLLRSGWLNASKHGMLGLGDIVIPGIFIALLLRFDNYVSSTTPHHGSGRKSKGHNDKQQPPRGSKRRYYCAVTVCAYALGLLITMGVMHYFKAAQPALLYLVPTCMLTPLALAALRGEARALWNYSEEQFVEQHHKDEEEEHKKEKGDGDGSSASAGEEEVPSSPSGGAGKGKGGKGGGGGQHSHQHQTKENAKEKKTK